MLRHILCWIIIGGIIAVIAAAATAAVRVVLLPARYRYPAVAVPSGNGLHGLRCSEVVMAGIRIYAGGWRLRHKMSKGGKLKV